MLIDDVRARIKERLVFLGVGSKSNLIKKRLAGAGLSETYLDHILVSRREGTPPNDPTITKIELVAQVLDVSLAWLLLGIGRPEIILSAKAEVSGGRDAKKPSHSAPPKARRKK
jgi:hypothetical protein